MKSIGIITFHESPNYGAILQSYALKKYLDNRNYDTKIIDYRNPHRNYAQVTGFRRLRSMVWAHTGRLLVYDYKRAKKTKYFQRNYINLGTMTYKSHYSILKNPPQFDCYITGSDQVWNKRNNNCDMTYFLDFVPEGKIRISYAPSFGTRKIDEQYLSMAKPFINKIKYLSVREKSGAKIIGDFCSREAKVVCDPIFLLSREEWKEVMKCPINGHYILCYYMPGDKIVETKIKEIANILHEKTGFPILNIGKKEYKKIYFWESNMYGYGPKEFVGAIYKADYIVTNSFHGTAFSILFEKAVFVPYRSDIAKENALNTRLIELLDSANRVDSLVSCDEQFDISKKQICSMSGGMIDFITQSKQFLMNAVEGY